MITIRIVFLFIFFCITHPLIVAQEWTAPVDVSLLPGQAGQPDLWIGKNGVIHIVFTYNLAPNWKKIMYCKSNDNGNSWTVPEDISMNSDLSMTEPHICLDALENIFVSYDYNTGNPSLTMVYMRINNNDQWGGNFVVSEGMPGSYHNKIYIDKEDKIYIFWIFNGQMTYYKTFKNDLWSDPVCPYPGNHVIGILSADFDKQNNLHCAGVFWENGQTPDDTRVVYLKKLENGLWLDKVFISKKTSLFNQSFDIAAGCFDEPHIAWQQRTGGNPFDSTLYCYHNGNQWVDPELVVNDPYGQRIVLDNQNKVHIADWEKMEAGYKMMHYQKVNNLWEGTLIDSSGIVVAMPEMKYSNGSIYLTYYKCISDENCRIRFTTMPLITSSQQKSTYPESFRVYPNPSIGNINIEFEISENLQVVLAIYDLNGKKIVDLSNEPKSPGKHKMIWNGKDLNGKEVKSGLYLVRLMWGRKIYSQPVEIIH